MSTRSNSRDVLTVLARHAYEADEQTIESLARLNATSVDAVEGVRCGYLRALVAEVKKKSKGRGRRKGMPAKEALTETHKVFNAAVLRGVMTPELTDSDKLSKEERHDRALKRNAKSNFARAAKSVVLKFLEAGGDVHTLDATKVTWTELKTFALSMTQAAPVPPEQLAHRVELAANTMEERARELADKDKDAATHCVQSAMRKLTDFLSELGRAPTTKASVAMKEHRPLQTDIGMFFPIPTQQEVSAAVQ